MSRVCRLVNMAPVSTTHQSVRLQASSAAGVDHTFGGHLPARLRALGLTAVGNEGRVSGDGGQITGRTLVPIVTRPSTHAARRSGHALR